MNRPIKFRVWTGAVMEYKIMAGYLGHFYVSGMNEKDSACMSDANTVYNEAAPLMQWTGLLDKNGCEIYEGDVIKVDRFHVVTRKLSANSYTGDLIEDGVEIGWVRWGDIEWLMDFDYKRYDDIYPIYKESNRLEVIGNIYENPNLVAYKY